MKKHWFILLLLFFTIPLIAQVGDPLYSWKLLHPYPTNKNISKLWSLQGNYYLTAMGNTSTDLFFTTDWGKNWNLREFNNIAIAGLQSRSGELIIAGTEVDENNVTFRAKILVSNDNGYSWSTRKIFDSVLVNYFQSLSNG